jgi:NADH-quinone oxidoreductase subunit N
MGLLYGYTGETNISNIGAYIWYTPELNQIKIGALFLIIGLLFKLGSAPFHMWLPDVYEGAPTIVTAYFAIVPKISILLTLINLLTIPFIGIWYTLQPIIIISTILSIIIGSIGAINQGKIKRLISYSAISHIGFIFIGIIPLSLYSIQATIIYVLIYIILSLNTFTILLSLNQYNYISQFSGLSRSNPILAFTFAFTLLSIAGIPPLAGFFSKYLVLINVIDNGYYLIAFIAVIGSAISTFYYLRIIKWMFFKDSMFFYWKDLGDIIHPLNLRINFISSIVLGVTLWIILTFLFYPKILTSFIFYILSTSLI